MRLVLLFNFCLCSCLLFAQNSTEGSASKSINHIGMMWFDYIENIYIRQRWWVQAEATERFFTNPALQWQTGARVYGLYHVGENWHIGPGFSVWFPKVGDVTTHELRVAQQFFYRQKMEKRQRFGIHHRFKVEERFVRNVADGELADDYTFSLRFRYRLWFEYTIAKLGGKQLPVKLFVNEEVFLQAGKNVIYNVFDQNRMNAGITVTVAKGTSVSLCYLNLFRQQNSGNKYDDFHSFRIFFTHDLSVPKKKKQ